MPFQGEGPGPRGFAREGVLPTSETDAPAAHLLALAEPAASLVTLYPPTLEELAGSREATLLYMHQLITAAKLEEQQHASYQRCSGIRNLRLLEHQVHHDLFRAELSAPETKAAVVQTELTCERLFRNLVELIETHDKFWVATFLEGEANLGETALFDGLYVTELAQALAVGEAVVDETLDRVTAAASRDQAVVNPQLREQLVALQGVCPRLDVPRLAVVMALDFPEIVSPFPGGEPPAPGPETPFSVVDEPTVGVETIDVTDRFMRIAEVFDRFTVQRALDRCPADELVATAVDLVEKHSTVRVAATREQGTLHEYPAPLLDGLCEATADAERLGRQLRGGFLQIVPAMVADGKLADAALSQTVGDLFYHVGGVAVHNELILVNPYVAAEWYPEVWMQEYVSRRLVDQLVQITVDDAATRVQHPLDTFEWGSPAPEGLASMVAFTRMSADAFADIEVDGEADLRRVRAVRTAGVPSG